jgi:hypothetical protein
VEKRTFLILFLAGIFTAVEGRGDASSDSIYFSAAMELHRVLNLMAIERMNDAHPEQLKTDSQVPKMQELKTAFDELKKIQIENCGTSNCKTEVDKRTTKWLQDVDGLKQLDPGAVRKNPVLENQSFMTFIRKHGKARDNDKRSLENARASVKGEKPPYIRAYFPNDKIKLTWVPNPPAARTPAAGQAASVATPSVPDLWEQEKTAKPAP